MTSEEKITHLEDIVEKLRQHNDYLSENMNKQSQDIVNIKKYDDYLAQEIDKLIEYTEHLAGIIDKNIVSFKTLKDKPKSV